MPKDMATVETTRDADVLIVTLNRPEVRNAIDLATAQALNEAFVAFDRDKTANVAVLSSTGEDGHVGGLVPVERDEGFIEGLGGCQVDCVPHLGPVEGDD